MSLSSAAAGTLAELRISVLERGWLSSNNVVLRPRKRGAATVVDTGYTTHEVQTLALVQQTAGPAGVARVVNTHLHSDHCGGNAALQARWPCETWVPEVSLDAVNRWDTDALTFALTDQRCPRFRADRGFAIGEALHLADEEWLAVAAPGHDPDATMLWHAGARVLISGDALWETRLAIIFPELDGRPGFAQAEQVLDCIESLSPTVVIPGHGAPFSDVAAAVARSRTRLAQFAAEPARHLEYAARALAMFHMLEQRRQAYVDLVQWLTETPVFSAMLNRLGGGKLDAAARQVVDRLLSDHALFASAQGDVFVADEKKKGPTREASGL